MKKKQMKTATKIIAPMKTTLKKTTSTPTKLLQRK